MRPANRRAAGSRSEAGVVPELPPHRPAPLGTVAQKLEVFDRVIEGSCRFGALQRPGEDGIHCMPVSRSALGGFRGANLNAIQQRDQLLAHAHDIVYAPRPHRDFHTIMRWS